MTLVEARGLSKSKAEPEPDENLKLGRFTRAQLRKMIRTKIIQDAKTLVGLLWLFHAGGSKI